jgi:hypothetical protein
MTAMMLEVWLHAGNKKKNESETRRVLLRLEPNRSGENIPVMSSRSWLRSLSSRETANLAKIRQNS